jgi:hypothetical protein
VTLARAAAREEVRAVRPLDEEAGRDEERRCDEPPEDERLYAYGLHGDSNVADYHAEVKSVAPLVPDTRCRDAITDREMRAPSAGSRSRDGTGQPPRRVFPFLPRKRQKQIAFPLGAVLYAAVTRKTALPHKPSQTSAVRELVQEGLDMLAQARFDPRIDVYLTAHAEALASEGVRT